MDAPLIPAQQFRRIAVHLPVNRRNRRVISALAFRISSGGSLRDVGELFHVGRCRLNTWERDLADILPGILKSLRLHPAPARAFRKGGLDFRRRAVGVFERSTAYRLQTFGEALGRRRTEPASRPPRSAQKTEDRPVALPIKPPRPAAPEPGPGPSTAPEPAAATPVRSSTPQAAETARKERQLLLDRLSELPPDVLVKVLIP